jgi:hypothetical protein
VPGRGVGHALRQEFWLLDAHTVAAAGIRRALDGLLGR